MECSCAIDVYSDDCEPVGCLTNGYRIARKEHKCRECGGIISNGERYWHTSYVFYGKWYHDKACPDCDSAIRQFFPKGGYCDLWTDIAVEISEIDGEIPESCIAKLTPAARGKLCDLIDRHYQRREKRQGFQA